MKDHNWLIPSVPIGIIILAVAFVIELPALPSHAANHHNKRIVVNSVVAVPVAVPVATYAPVQYKNQAVPFTTPPVSERDLLIRDLAKALALELRGDAPVKQLAPVTMFAKKCASCHSKENPDGRPVFAVGLDGLTQEQRLASIRAIVSEKMPKSSKVTPQEVGQLMLELSTIPEAPGPVADLPNNPEYRAVPIEEAIKNGMPPPLGYKSPEPKAEAAIQPPPVPQPPEEQKP